MLAIAERTDHQRHATDRAVRSHQQLASGRSALPVRDPMTSLRDAPALGHV
jgi:hypothetical protein